MKILVSLLAFLLMWGVEGSDDPLAASASHVTPARQRIVDSSGVFLPDDTTISTMTQLQAKQEATRLLRVIEGSPHKSGEIDPSVSSMSQLQAKTAVRELAASIKSGSQDSSPLLRSRSMAQLQANGASGGQKQQTSSATAAAQSQHQSTAVLLRTNDVGSDLLDQAKAAGLAHRWCTDEYIEANYLRAPTVAGYATLIKKMLHSSVIGSFTSALGTILSTDVNTANMGSYGGARNFVYASDAKDPKFMGRAFKHYIDEQLATPTSRLAQAVATASAPHQWSYVPYKQLLGVLKTETETYFKGYFASPDGYAYDGRAKITVNDLARTVADMVYESLKVKAEEDRLKLARTASAIPEATPRGG